MFYMCHTVNGPCYTKDITMGFYPSYEAVIQNGGNKILLLQNKNKIGLTMQ